MATQKRGVKPAKTTKRKPAAAAGMTETKRKVGRPPANKTTIAAKPRARRTAD